jgi:Domain of unknown function (DUF3854)
MAAGGSVSGVDPLANWNRMIWGQLKPNTPREAADKPGKLIKYESPDKVPTRAILLDVNPKLAEAIYLHLGFNPPAFPLPFWQTVAQFNLPIAIIEGAKKAGCLMSMGYPAIALPGIWNGRKYLKDLDGRHIGESLIPELQAFATPGRRVVFVFDQDEKVKTQVAVAQAIERTSSLFIREGCACYNAEWEGSYGKGIDDLAAGVAGMAHRIIGMMMQNAMRLT